MPEDDQACVIMPRDLEKIRVVMKRLYSQDRMDADCMRDHAQILQSVVDDVIMVNIDDINA